MKNSTFLVATLLTTLSTFSCIENTTLNTPIEQEEEITKTGNNRCYSCEYDDVLQPTTHCDLSVIEMEELKKTTPEIIECYKTVD